MQRHLQRLVPGWVGVAGVVGAFLFVSAVSGCPGTLDPTLAGMASGSGGSGSGSGGSNNSGGSTGSGGSSNSGGSTGSGGSSTDCTGNNDINFIVMGTGDSRCPGTACNACAQSGCHIPDSGSTKSASLSGGLDMTLDSGIGSRLIGVFSGTTANASECTSSGKNYLDAQSNPATGLLIDKIKANPSCGKRMPYPGITVLTSAQITCFQNWAESLIMAAP
jgi:hypothetical protein